jgi:hypothetical protein
MGLAEEGGMTRSDRIFDGFCWRMIIVSLAGALIVGAVVQRTDILAMEDLAKQTMPGCRTKYTCSVSYEHGKPVVEMVRRENNGQQ